MPLTCLQLRKTGQKALYSPYTVTCTAVAPTTFHLSKTCDAALLSSEAAAWAVYEFYAWLWVYCEVEEKTHHLSVSENV